MRERQKILGNLEGLYREALQRADAVKDDEVVARLDFEFQKDQLHLEVLMDIRELLATMDPGEGEAEKTTSLLEKAQAIRRLTKLR